MTLLPFVAAGIGTGSVYALSGVGLVVLYRSSGTLNFAFGALGAIGAYCTWSVLRLGVPPALAWVAGIAVSTAGSFLYGLLIAPLLRHRDRAVRSVGTLGFALFILGCTGLIWGEAVPRRLTFPTDQYFALIFGVRVTYTRLLALCIAISMVGAITLLLGRTRLGLSMRSLAADRHLSSLLGIPVVRIDAVAWLISGLFAGVAGLLLADLVALNAVFLTFLVIPAIAAAIFGRLQSLAGTALGGFIAGIAEAVLSAEPAVSSYRSAVPFVLALPPKRGALRVGPAFHHFRRWTPPRGDARMTIQERTVVMNARPLASLNLSGTYGSLLAMVATLAVLAAIIVLTAGGYWLSIFTSSFAIALAAAGTGLLYGRLGLISLCQFALVGIGGWVTLRIYHAFHPPFEICLAAGGLGAGFIGVLWGLPAIRMRGLYLALATLMLAGTFQVVISNWSFPNGGTGFLGFMGDRPRIDIERPPIATSDAGYFIYVTVVLALGLALVEWHRRAKPGRAWALISRNELMAEASGVRLVFYKTWAFALAGVLAGIAGGLLAGCYGGLDGGAFTAADSLLLFAVAVMGGVGDWRGAVLAGLLFRVPPALLNYFGVNGFLATMLFGAGLIHAPVTAPEGISGQIKTLITSLKGRREDGAPS